MSTGNKSTKSGSGISRRHFIQRTGVFAAATTLPQILPSGVLARGGTPGANGRIGVGFIGAGAIIRQGDITTGNAAAASVWVVGVIGAAVSYGYYDIGIILVAANLAVLLIRTPL